MLWAPHLGPGVAGTSIPEGQWAAANICHPGLINTGIHVIPLASAREHTEGKAMLVFVLTGVRMEMLQKVDYNNGAGGHSM